MMNVLPVEMFAKIANYLNDDIHDWIHLMLTCKRSHSGIQPKFIRKKFKVLILYDISVPSCSINNYKIKKIKNIYSKVYIITDHICIKGHCQFKNFYIYETYGLFFKGFCFDPANNLIIDHNIIFDFIGENENLINICKSIYKKTKGSKYPSFLDLKESCKLSHQYIKLLNDDYYLIRKQALKIQYKKNFKLNIKDSSICMNNIRLLSGLCLFCCNNTKKDEHNEYNEYYGYYRYYKYIEYDKDHNDNHYIQK
jgi:hypothetical protein